MSAKSTIIKRPQVMQSLARKVEQPLARKVEQPLARKIVQPLARKIAQPLAREIERPEDINYPIRHTIDTTADGFLDQNFEIWPGQRPLNEDHVTMLLEKQQEFIQTRGSPLFAAAFVVINCKNKTYLIDGQHRREILTRLPDRYLSSTSITVTNLNCGDDGLLATDIYLQCNDGYATNTSISEDKRFICKNRDDAILIVEELRRLYPKQVGKSNCNAPNFHPEDLAQMINESGILEHKDYKDVIKLIIAKNKSVGIALKDLNDNQWRTANGKSGFFLPYQKPPRFGWLKSHLKLQLE